VRPRWQQRRRLRGRLRGLCHCRLLGAVVLQTANPLQPCVCVLLLQDLLESVCVYYCVFITAARTAIFAPISSK
jgi:hypothetical protein